LVSQYGLEGVSEQRSDTEADQARICARDKTGNRKETTQNPALPNLTEPLFIFQEERKKNNINNIRCSTGKRKGRDKRRRRRRLGGNLDFIKKRCL
ncbi:hypothetical protein JOQ06_017764, partial [Pogonophryne albipinna]